MKIRSYALPTCLALQMLGDVAQRESGIHPEPLGLTVTPPLRDLHGIILAKARDCGTRLDFAHLFERLSPSRIGFEGIVLIDAGDDASMTRARSLLGGLRFLRGTPAHKRLLRTTRRPHTPVLILYTREKVLRMALEAPRTVQAADRLTNWLASPANQ